MFLFELGLRQLSLTLFAFHNNVLALPFMLVDLLLQKWLAATFALDLYITKKLLL
jgi:hypothetical protein